MVSEKSLTEDNKTEMNTQKMYNLNEKLKEHKNVKICKIFSTPIILNAYQNHCPNCCSFDIHWEENCEQDGKRISIFECNFCGAYWEVEKVEQ
jgi:predicted RNA-binding Zn-ribbon protein involved in translation (DUF1610 family)